MEGEINEQKGSVFEKLIDCNENSLFKHLPYLSAF